MHRLPNPSSVSQTQVPFRTRYPVSPFLDRPGLDPTAILLPALHLIDGRWIASCPTCGCILAEGGRQDRVEHKAARRSCPVCVEVA
jgi:hypothetical protein